MMTDDQFQQILASLQTIVNLLSACVVGQGFIGAALYWLLFCVARNEKHF